ncbi:MAG: non-homologous end-joining DNA ligase [Actinomycetota bacterium]
MAIKPMKAVAGRLPVGDGWAYEIKWDGMRAIAALGDGGVRARSSRLNDITPRFPELQPLAETLAVDAVLDGELVAMGDDGLPSFSRMQGRMHLDRPHDIARKSVEIPIVYVVFDVLAIDGTDTLRLPYEQRRQLLEQILEPGPTWQLATVHREEPEALLDAVVERGMEGLVAKRLTSTYQPGARSADWVKVKPRRRQELVVGGLLSGEGDRLGSVAAVLVGYHDETGLRFAGRVGSGLTDAEGRELVQRTSPQVDSPFVDDVPGVRGRTITFVEPELVVEVAFGEWTPDDNLRHPVYLGRRTDVDPTFVPREPDPTP